MICPALPVTACTPLKGNRKGQWAMTINGPWRVCFTPSEEGWENVEIVDYH
jgi:proteic killer suppression protein